MIHGIETNETLEVRRALDRLQHTLLELGDRYRELRRERRHLYEYIDELEQEHQKTVRALAAREEEHASDRKRLVELEERFRLAERSNVDLYNSVSELERKTGERESVMVEQAMQIEQLSAALRDEQQRGIETRRELEMLHVQLAERPESDGPVLQQLRERIEVMDRELNDAREQLADSEERRRRETEDREGTERRIAELTEQLASIVAENERLGSDLAAASADGEGARGMIESQMSDQERQEMIERVAGTIEMIDRYLQRSEA